MVRFLDYGQFKYEQTRREKEARRHQRSVEFKEVRLTPKIGRGDFETKVRRAVEFLEAGGRVKVSVRFRGRELTHAYLGRDLLMKFADEIKEHGAVERQPLLEGKSMSIVIASTHKPKVVPATGAAARPAAADGEAAPRPAAADSEAAPRPAAPGPAAASAPAPAEAPASAEVPVEAPAPGEVAAETAAPRPVVAEPNGGEPDRPPRAPARARTTRPTEPKAPSKRAPAAQSSRSGQPAAAGE